jgi:hypothetical protein
VDRVRLLMEEETLAPRVVGCWHPCSLVAACLRSPEGTGRVSPVAAGAFASPMGSHTCPSGYTESYQRLNSSHVSISSSCNPNTSMEVANVAK